MISCRGKGMRLRTSTSELRETILRAKALRFMKKMICRSPLKSSPMHVSQRFQFLIRRVATPREESSES